MQDAGARRVSNAEGIRRIERKHDCALLAQYTKHSNARGHSLALTLSPMQPPCLFFTEEGDAVEVDLKDVQQGTVRVGVGL